MENLKITLNKAKLIDRMNLECYEETPTFQAYMRLLLHGNTGVVRHWAIIIEPHKIPNSSCVIAHTLYPQVIKTISLWIRHYVDIKIS